jgi:hypothetical protein
MRTFASRATAALIAAGATVSTAALLAGPAAAAAPPALSFLPANGLASTPMYVFVPKPCPAAGTNIIATAFGHGFPADGQPVVGNSTAGISHTTPFALPLQDTFVGFAADNGTTLSGPYKIMLSCISALGDKTYASFTAIVTFTDAAHFTAPAPTAALVEAIAKAEQPTGKLAPSGSAGKSSGTGSSAGKSLAAQASKAAGGSGSTPGGSGTGGSAPLTQTANAATRAKSAFPWQPTLIVAAFVLIGLGILLRIREVRRGHRRDTARLKARPTSKLPASADPPEKSPSLTSSASANNHVKGNHS